jgi:hypothetical protein
MRAWSRVALALVCAGAVTSSASAQTELIGLEKIHQLFAANQTRAAVRELSMVSVEFRTEIGRCRDESIGARLVELEPKFDDLAAKMNAGTLTSASALDKEFVVIDRLLAESHEKLAASGWGLRRFGQLETVAKDLALAANYAVRSAKWAHQPLAPELQKAVDDALATAEKLAADPANPPEETGAVIEAFGNALRGPN